MATPVISFLLIFFVSLHLTSCGRSEKTGSSTKSNTPPEITAASIFPENPTQKSDLGIMIQSKDPDDDPITYDYQWIKNDAEIIGETKPVLKSGTFKKGDIIQVKVIPSDGKVNGAPFFSGSVKILNSPPVIQEISIEPKTAFANNDLKVIVKGFDPDGDFIYYNFRWEKNGVELSEENKEILKQGNFKKGDTITVTVTPDDREVTGEPKKSVPITILNSPPAIVSSPPESIKDSQYIYQVKAHDPDHDPVTFILKSGPKGMEIDQKTGLLRWDIRKEDKGTHQIEIEALDSEGAKSIQRYVLTVDFKQKK